jgi:hypothetical protein
MSRVGIKSNAPALRGAGSVANALILKNNIAPAATINLIIIITILFFIVEHT